MTLMKKKRQRRYELSLISFDCAAVLPHKHWLHTICQLAAFILRTFPKSCKCVYVIVDVVVVVVLLLIRLKCNFPIARCYFPLSLFISFNFCFVALSACQHECENGVWRSKRNKERYAFVIIAVVFCFASSSLSLSLYLRHLCLFCVPGQTTNFISIPLTKIMRH